MSSDIEKLTSETIEAIQEANGGVPRPIEIHADGTIYSNRPDYVLDRIKNIAGNIFRKLKFYS
tara:strand:- start:816 stop:1004 length:189 start_codon:yes stop_codon:yes gene_type:complete